MPTLTELHTSMMYYHNSFQGLILSGASVAPTSQVCEYTVVIADSGWFTCWRGGGDTAWWSHKPTFSSGKVSCKLKLSPSPPPPLLQLF